MTSSVPASRTRRIGAGVLAGLLAGVAIDAFLILIQAALSGASPASVASGVYGWIAGVTLGHPGQQGPIAAGVLGHFAVAAAWGGGYGYLVDTRPQLLARPLVSGLGYGIVVWFLMQLVLIAGHAYHNPNSNELATSLVGHTVFFGVPLAYATARLLQRS